jgi:transcriptional regulator of acetoin/glycerol metabolism
VGNPYIHYTKTRSRTDRLWERFQLGRVTDESVTDPYESMVVRDWSRCRNMGINPTMREGVVLPEQEYRARLERKSFVLQKAQQILDNVREVLTGVPGILMFADEQGTILYITGDSSVRIKAADCSRIVEGSTWLESSSGTNGIGTAIAKKTSVHVFSSEHYCNGWHAWTCAASPVTDPFTDELLGVIDFTTIDKDYREDAVGLTYSLAGHITTKLRLQMEIERLQLIHQFTDHASRYPSDAITVVDRMGRVVRSNSDREPDPLSFVRSEPRGGEQPEEIRKVCLSGTETEIGTLLVARRARSLQVSPPALRPAIASYGGFVTANRDVIAMMTRIEKMSPSDINILLIGETGTGKEMIASYIHEKSNHHSGPFVAINCGAISKDLFEAKLFGYERGAFTGADPKGRMGLFESADRGTLFLDEIGELPLDIQAALLRVLETRRLRRIGATTEVETHCRIVAATNRPLQEEVRLGKFRADLYYRLSVAKFVIPPLRARPEDIPVILGHTLTVLCQKHGMAVKSIAQDAMECFARHDWPGNAREVRNVLESTIMSAGDPITLEDLPGELLQVSAELPAHDEPLAGAAGDGSISTSTRNHERAVITAALEKHKNIGGACDCLGISRATLYRKFRSLKINPKDHL